MSESSRSSMAAVLSVVMTVLMWVLAVIGGLIVLAFGFGIVSSLFGAELDTPPTRLFLLMIGAAVLTVVSVYICAQLRKILSTLALGDPFVPENASRLRRLAIAITVMEILRYVAKVLAYVLPDVGTIEKNTSILPNVAAVAAIIVLFVLAQVFKEGARLRAEEKMTI